MKSALESFTEEANRYVLLTADQEIALARKIQSGDQKALEELTLSNLRLVISIAQNYTGMGVSLEDLIAEGNIGLMIAAKRFDPARKCRFSTVGALWIKQRIRRALSNQARLIRLPVNLTQTLSKLHRIEMRLEEKFGTEPTTGQVAAAMQISKARVRRARTSEYSVVSMDQKVDESNPDSQTIEEVLTPSAGLGGESQVSPFEDLANGDQIEALREIIKSLPEREREIIVRRFGLDGERPQTLEKVGRDFKVTRERIRQIQNIVLRKIKSKILKHQIT